MDKAVDEIISRLADIEDTANRMNDAVEERKKEISAAIEEKTREFDLELKNETAKKQAALDIRMEQERDEELAQLRAATQKALKDLQEKYDMQHEHMSDEIVKSIIRL